MLFLDYDGTLTPIVATPDLAVLTPQMRDTLKKLSQQLTVAIVSGRATDDVRGKVQLEGVFYAGSHGFEIVAPSGAVTIHPEAQKMRPVINAVHALLADRLKDIPGALVENVKYTISAHYRLVSSEKVPRMEKEVSRILRDYPQLRKTDGKKVFELRPKIDWDKGKAVEWILNYLQYDSQKHFCVYLGDDTTDEDAFRAVRDRGFGILVSDVQKPSLAQYMIRHTKEVENVLDVLKDFGRKKER